VRDSFTALDYADQRYYASSYGRFNTADRLASSAMAGDPGSWNRYSYAGGDPINRSDPKGLCSQDIDYNWWDDDEVPEGDFSGVMYPGNCTDSPVWVAWANSMAPGSVSLNGSPYYPGGGDDGDDSGGPDSGWSSGGCATVTGSMSFTYSCLRPAGKSLQQDWKAVVKAIRADKPCATWLGTNVPGHNLFKFLSKAVVDEASAFLYSNGVYAFTVQGTEGDIAGVDIIVNDMGADPPVETLLHEIAHFVSAPNFLPEGLPGGGISYAQENLNAALLKEYCGSAIAKLY